MLYSRISFLILFCAFTSNAISQQIVNSTAITLTAMDHINALKEGVLLVRLPSDRKKIEKVEEMLKRDELSAKEYTRLTKIHTQSLLDIAELHKDIKIGLDSNYTFSQYAYFWDYDAKEVRAGTGKLYLSDMTTPFVLEDNLPIYFLSIGDTPETSINAFIILDHNFNMIARPFPGSISRSGFAGLFSNDIKHIARLNEKLWRNHEKWNALY